MSGMSGQLLAMHGWAGDSRAWEPWRLAAEQRGWSWQCGERGYGSLPPRLPAWESGSKPGRRAVLAHSLGLHLLPPAVLAAADAVVLLASFAAFVPAGRDGRPLRAALGAMEARLAAGLAAGLLADFLRQAAAPDPADLLPPGPGSEPLEAAGIERLRSDLALLGRVGALPAAFPPAARVLLVEAEDDRIVAAASRAALRRALSEATVWPIAGAGHSLLRAPLIEPVLTWLEAA